MGSCFREHVIAFDGERLTEVYISLPFSTPFPQNNFPFSHPSSFQSFLVAMGCGTSVGHGKSPLSAEGRSLIHSDDESADNFSHNQTPEHSRTKVSSGALIVMRKRLRLFPGCDYTSEVFDGCEQTLEARRPRSLSSGVSNVPSLSLSRHVHAQSFLAPRRNLMLSEEEVNAGDTSPIQTM
jgi:hypothetical protein